MPTAAKAVSVEPRFRIRYGRRLAFGPGKAELLERIEQTGSITEAAKQMGMFYLRAWTPVRSTDREQSEPLVQTARGGHARGGAMLTETGREVLRLYRELETRSMEATTDARAQLARLLTGEEPVSIASGARALLARYSSVPVGHECQREFGGIPDFAVVGGVTVPPTVTFFSDFQPHLPEGAIGSGGCPIHVPDPVRFARACLVHPTLGATVLAMGL